MLVDIEDVMKLFNGVSEEEFYARGVIKNAIKKNTLPAVDLPKKDVIQEFHDYQIEWLKSHYDIVLEPDLEDLMIHFLHDTANCFCLDLDKETGGKQE